MGSVSGGSYVYLSMDRVIYGPDTIRVLPSEIDRIGGRRAFVVTTGSTVRSNCRRG